MQDLVPVCEVSSDGSRKLQRVLPGGLGCKGGLGFVDPSLMCYSQYLESSVKKFWRVCSYYFLI